MTFSFFKRDSIHPLTGVGPNLPLNDLHILRNVVAQARIVALGEPTHGQREINQLRDRMTRYLVQHEGFRVVAVEDSAIKVRVVNDFLSRGEGTAESALQQQNYWTWRTKEYLALIKWLRVWNTEHPNDMVRFIGIDFQDMTTPAEYLVELIQDHNLKHLKSGLSEIGEIEIWGASTFDDRRLQRYVTTLSSIQQFLETTKIVDEDHRRFGLDCVLSLEQALDLWREVAHSPEEITAVRWNCRDEAMAARALAAIESNNRMVLWAQNGHIQTEQMDWMPPGAFTMGQVLQAHLAAGYVVISGMFGSGSYRGFDLTNGQMGVADVGDPPEGTLEHALWKWTQDPAVFVSLDNPDPSLFKPQSTRWAGAALETSENMNTTVRPAIGSNAIAFVRRATPSEPI